MDARCLKQPGGEGGDSVRIERLFRFSRASRVSNGIEKCSSVSRADVPRLTPKGGTREGRGRA